MQETRIDSSVTPYVCPIAGKTVYIRRTWSLVPEGAMSSSAKSVCDNQHRCIAAKLCKFSSGG
ncbi:hypothetical protein [Lysobacter tyrosinilyticus]